MPNSVPTSPMNFRPSLFSVALWPIIGGLCFFLAPILDHRNSGHFFGMLGGPVLATFGLAGWWVRVIRGQGAYRWLPPVLLVVPAVIIAAIFYHKAEISVIVFGLPWVGLVWAVWMLVSYAAAWPVRRAGVIVAILAAWSAFCLVRVDETDAEIMPELSWRWQPTKEDLYRQERAARATAGVAPAPPASVERHWPEFRGPKRDGLLPNVNFGTDWATTPPKLLWKQRIGPGWGTFSVVGDRLFTQEQRDDKEAVVCLSAVDGREVWSHETPARFFEQIAGAGPRGTPTVVDGKVYSLGATGLLNCLDQATGKVLWQVDVTTDTGGAPPQWGYAGSPLIVRGLAVVYVGGKNGKGTAAFSTTDGKLVWAAGKATHGYSSAHLATLGGVEHILMLSNFGIEGFDIATGAVLWADEWNQKDLNRVTQPIILDGTDVVYGTGVGPSQGVRRIQVTPPAEAKAGSLNAPWDVKTVWQTKAIKPYFNDGVVIDGHLYGFDDKKFVCVRLSDGVQKWTTGTEYGHGQVLGLPDAKLLLVQAVDGKVAVLKADPNEHNELGKFAAVAGKTWNHPVVAAGKLYVRNGKETAAYELPKP